MKKSEKIRNFWPPAASAVLLVRNGALLIRVAQRFVWGEVTVSQVLCREWRHSRLGSLVVSQVSELDAYDPIQLYGLWPAHQEHSLQVIQGSDPRYRKRRNPFTVMPTRVEK